MKSWGKDCIGQNTSTEYTKGQRIQYTIETERKAEEYWGSWGQDVHEIKRLSTMGHIRSSNRPS